MAAQDSKLTGLTELTSATADDILYIVNDPSGVALGQKITVANLFNYTSFGTANTLAKFSSGGGLEDSSITDNGTTVTITSLFDVVGDAEVNGTLRVSNTNEGIGIQDPTDLSGWVMLRTLNSGSPLLGSRKEKPIRFSAYNSDTVNSGYVGDVASFGYDDGISLLRNTDISGNLAVDTDTFVVDAVNDAVSIGETNSSTSLVRSGVLTVFNTDTTINNTSTIAFSFSSSSGSFSRIGVQHTSRSSGSETQELFLGTLTSGSYFERLRLSASLVEVKNSNFAVDTDTLFVDASTGRVGIQNSSPSVALDVVGDAKISGTINGQTISTGTNAAVASGTWINTVAAVDGNFYEIYGKTEVATSNVRYYNQVMIYNSGTVQGLGISSSLNMEFQVSGGNLQLRQTTGAARDIIWTVIKRN